MKSKTIVRRTLLLCTLLLGVWIGTTAINQTDVHAAEAWAVRDSHNLSGYSYNTRESEHFRIIWGNEDVNLGAYGQFAPVAKTDEFINGNLQNLESTREFFINELGLSDIGRPPSSPYGQRYKLNVYISYTGLGNVVGDDWAYMTTDAGGYAYLVLDPDAMQVYPQSTVIPHELAHAFTHHMGGVTTWEWYEPVANFCRNEWLKSSYYKTGPDTDYIDTFLLNTEWRYPSVKKWYEIWPILTYIYENPDNIPGLGKNEIIELLKDPRYDDRTYFHKLERVTGVPIEDIIGGCERRLVTMDFERQDLYMQDLNRLKATNYHDLYTTLEDAGDGWLKVPDHRAPQQTGYNIIPLNVDLRQDYIDVDFEGLNYSWNAGWRISIVTVTNTGDTRYSGMWSSGSNSMMLQGDETAAYLVVSATPADLEPIYVFNNDGSSNVSDTERFPYKVKITTGKLETIERKVLADFTFDDHATGFRSEHAKAAGSYSLSEYSGGNALYLNGAGDFLEVTAADGSSLLSGARELTVSFMANLESGSPNWLFYAAPNAATQQFLQEKYLGVLANGTLAAERFNNHGSRPASAATAMSTNQWNHVSIVYSARETIIYVNGNEVSRTGSLYSVSGILDDNSICYIGKANWGAGEYYKGLIDNYKIVNYAMSPEEVASEYQFATKPVELAKFTFDDEVSRFTNGYAVASGNHSLVDFNGGKALYLDGSDDYLEVKTANQKSLLTGVKELTVMLQAKPNQPSANWMFYASPNAEGQNFLAEKYLGIFDNNGSVLAERFQNNGSRPISASANIETGQWYHIAVVYTETETILYINGVEVSRQPSEYSLTDLLKNDSILYIGKANWGNGEYFSGLIDNYTIVRKELSASEIQAEAEQFLATNPNELPGLLAYFDFDTDGAYLNGRNAKATGTYTLEDSRDGKALKLNGNGQYLSLTAADGSSLLSGYDELTISFQMNPESNGPNWGFYAAANDAIQEYENEKYIGIFDVDGYIIGERYNNNHQRRPARVFSRPGYGNWYYVTVVYTQSETILYVDGQEVSREASIVDISDLLGGNSVAYIGKAPWGNGEFYKGLIDNYKIFGRALTVDEVASEAARYVD